MVAVEWSQGVEDAWSDVATFVPKLFAFLVILVIGYIIVMLIAKAVDAVLERIGFDRMVERGGVGRAMERTKYDASDILAKIVFWALMLIVLQMAFGVFGDNPVSDMIAGVVSYLPNVIAAIIIIVVVAALAAAVREVIEAALGGLSYGRVVANGVAIAIIVVGIFAALNQLNIAPEIVNGLFYALLAIIAGSAIIAIGGGGIGPMRQRWENVLRRYDEEKPRLRQEMQTARGRIEARSEELGERARTAAEGDGDGRTGPGARSSQR